jgi:16S rRNA (uracil1498-N3)-methyltransferase
VQASALTVVLHVEAVEPLAGLDLPADGDVIVVVGPEGGISPRELEALTAAGGRPVRLGTTILRSSSAGPAALAVINAATRWR